MTAIYVRRGTSTEEANHEELQRVLNRRIGTGHSSQVELDLQTDLEQLKVLYKHIDKYHIMLRGGFAQTAAQALLTSTQLTGFFGERESVENALYPKEDFESYRQND